MKLIKNDSPIPSGVTIVSRGPRLAIEYVGHEEGVPSHDGRHVYYPHPEGWRSPTVRVEEVA